MLKKRIIPSLLIKNKKLVKGKEFKNYVNVGDPISAIKVYSHQYADELIFIRIDKNDPIEDLLKNTLTLITLSSGTIEDALNSKVPVILYDYKKRYKQMESSEIIENNKAVIYINEKNKFEYAIKKLRNSNNLDFSNYVYERKFEKTIDEKILPLLKD